MAYTVLTYNSMIADRVRNDAHIAAARASIRPGSVVAELGTGNGYFAILACRLGAAKVYAIESDEIIQTAQQIAQHNGCADRIEFIHALSTDVSLPERVDVVFSDLRGALPYYGRHIPSIIDARERFLKPGGILVPKRDEIFGAFVSSEKLFGTYTDAVPDYPEAPDLSSTRRTLRSSVMHATIHPADLATEPFHLATIDYATVNDPGFRGNMSWTATAPMVLHGVTIWFDATLIDGVTFSSGPLSQKMIYGRLFFPFEERIDLQEGDSVSSSIQGLLLESDYVWRWSTVATSRDGELRAQFGQSNLNARYLASAGRAFRKDGTHIPPSTENHQLAKFVLQRLDGVTSLEQIARELASAFPGSFAESEAALAFTAEMVERIG